MWIDPGRVKEVGGGGPDLEVWAGDAGSDLLEERLLDPDELGGFDHVQDLFDLPQEHDLHTGTHTQ
jgi:hypothetical protein